MACSGIWCSHSLQGFIVCWRKRAFHLTSRSHIASCDSSMQSVWSVRFVTDFPPLRPVHAPGPSVVRTRQATKTGNAAARALRSWQANRIIPTGETRFCGCGLSGFVLSQSCGDIAHGPPSPEDGLRRGGARTRHISREIKGETGVPSQIASQKPGAFGHDLAQVVTAWVKLPAPLKAAILAIVGSVRGSEENQ
jgi:hypothetical protein